MDIRVYDQYLMTYISDQDDYYYPYFNFENESLLMIFDIPTFI